jgi:serine phosphatase RsbU (regulator of sigma subunit)/Tfp pilus assembly protein PilF
LLRGARPAHDEGQIFGLHIRIFSVFSHTPDSPMKSRLLFAFVLCLFVCGNLHARLNIDSLKTCASNPSLADTSRINCLHLLSEHYRDIDLNISLAYTDTALVLLKKTDHYKSKMRVYDTRATTLKMLGKYKQADTLYRSVLKLASQAHDSTWIAAVYSHIGSLYQIQQQSQLAVFYLLKAIQIDEKLDKREYFLAASLNNIGNVYYTDKNYTAAISYYKRALEINKKKKYGKWQAINYLNLGCCYLDQQQYDEAELHFTESIALAKKHRVIWVAAAAQEGLASIHTARGSYEKALPLLDSALSDAQHSGNIELVFYVYAGMAQAYTGLKQYDRAEQLWKMCMDSATHYNFFALRVKLMLSGAKLYEAKGELNRANALYRSYANVRDSINISEHATVYVDFEARLEQEKQAQLEELEQKRNAEIKDEELRRTRLVQYFLVLVIFLSIVAGFIAFRGYRQKKKSHEAISYQSDIIKEKNREIVDSITYAKRLQDAILPPLPLIRKYLPETFVLYRPKDIVAGDFYFFETVGNHFFIAAADCTGHGVPGALVSVVCSNALTRAVKEFRLTEPGQILDKVNELVEETFSRSESKVNDGMDISLVSGEFGAGSSGIKPGPEHSPSFKLNTPNLHWAGANNPLLLVRNGELFQTDPNSQPVGRFEHRKPFTTHTISVQQGDMLYLVTDGYADQFGGEKGKKLKTVNMKKLLVKNAALPVTAQEEELLKAHLEWKGNYEQVDDICVIGIRIG